MKYFTSLFGYIQLNVVRLFKVHLFPLSGSKLQEFPNMRISCTEILRSLMFYLNAEHMNYRNMDIKKPASPLFYCFKSPLK